MIQHYQIYLSSSAETGLNLTTSGSESYVLLDILEPNTHYTCAVAAVTVSVGPTTAAIHFTTNVAAPETVQYLMGTALTSRSINISWQPPLNEDTAGPTLDYHITISPLNENSEPRNITTSSTSIVVDMLHPGFFYLCIVASRVSAGLQQSTSVLLELPPDVPSSHPLNIIAVALDSNTLHLTWNPPPLEEQNGNIVQYGINITDIQSGEITQFFTSDSRASLTVPGLHPHYYYNYTVTAFTSVGNGPYSPSYSIQMPQDAPSSSPRNVTVTNVSPGIVSLLWLPPPLENQNGDITGYVMRITDLVSLKIQDIEIDDAVTETTKRGLRTEHLYNFSIAAVTAMGRGPFSYPVSILTLRGVHLAPTIGGAERISATQIKLTWSHITNDVGNAFYTVKYYPLKNDLRSRRTVADSTKFINTTKNSVTIPDLVPIFSYAVSVATVTDPGIGNFSDAITVGLSENSLFQLFFTGAIDCQQWVLYHIDAKLETATTEIFTDLERSCKCQISTIYVIIYQPQCLSAHTDWLILWGRIVGTNTSSSSDIIKHLQVWGDSESKVVVEGVHLTTLKFCSVSLNEGEPPFCETPTQATDAEGVNSSSNQESTSSVTYIIVGIVVLMMMLILAVLVCIGTVSLYRKKKVQERQMRFHAAHPLYAHDLPTIPSESAAKCKGDDDSNIYEQADSLYETIMDNSSPYSEPPSQPPPLPDSDRFMKKTLPQCAVEPQNTPSKQVDCSDDYSKPHFFPFESHAQRCPSPVEYAIMKPDACPAPDYETYATANEKGVKVGQLESTDDYLPMFDEENFNEKDTSTGHYQTLASTDRENAYQVPRKVPGENQVKTIVQSDEEEEEKGNMNDQSDCEAGAKESVRAGIEKGTDDEEAREDEDKGDENSYENVNLTEEEENERGDGDGENVNIAENEGEGPTTTE